MLFRSDLGQTSDAKDQRMMEIGQNAQMKRVYNDLESLNDAAHLGTRIGNE